MADLAHDSAETQRLLDQARSNTPGAVDRLLERHRAFVRRLVEVRLDPLLRARLDPSDVVQETQIEAVRRLDSYLERSPLSFRLWLRQVAQDRVLMLERRHIGARRRSVVRELAPLDGSSLAWARQLPAAGTSASGQLAAAELAQRVQHALSLLPAPDREIVELRNFEGLSNQEVAQLLGLKPAAASQRYGRALLRLRKLLTETSSE